MGTHSGVKGKSVAVGRSDLKRLGESQSVRRIDEIIEEVLAAIMDWDRWAAEAGLSKFRTDQVREEMPGFGI